MTRRSLLHKLSLGLMGASMVPHYVAGQWFPKKKIITISYNVYQFKGYPKTGDTQFILKDMEEQMPGRIALELALYKPNIITFQEAPEENKVKKVADMLGMNYVYFDGGFPGALLTKFDILASQNCPLVSVSSKGDLFSRHWGKATLQAADEQLIVYSAHLHPSDDDIRAREVSEVLEVIRKDNQSGQNAIFQGDLNHEPIQEEYQRWVKAGLIDCYARKGVEQQYTIKSTFPNRRVDYVWTNETMAKRLLRCRVLFEGGFRTNPMDERSVALSDHLPVMAEFS